MLAKRTKVEAAKIPGLVDYTVELIREKKGYHIMIISLDKLTTFTDFLIICTVDSSRQ
jgi:ribosomal silencing factor RsfS